MKYLFPILVFGVFLAGRVTSAAAQLSGDLFEQYEVVIGSAERQTVLTGFLLGGAVADLAVVNIDENDDRRLRIYAFGDSTWVPLLGATLHPQVSFVDVANIDGRDRLDCVRTRSPELVRSRIGDGTRTGGGDFQLQAASQRRNSPM